MVVQKVVDIPIYNRTLYIILCEGKTLEMVVETNHLHEDNLHAMAYQLDSGNVAVAFNTSDDIDYSVIAHESFHLAGFIFEHIECAITNDEPFAYLLQYIFTQIKENI